MAKLPPIRVWTEKVDDGCVAVLATCFKVTMRRTKERGKYVRRPFLRGYTCFFLTDPNYSYWRMVEAAERTIRDWFAEDGYLPYVGPCADLPGWSDYE